MYTCSDNDLKEPASNKNVVDPLYKKKRVADPASQAQIAASLIKKKNIFEVIRYFCLIM